MSIFSPSTCLNSELKPIFKALSTLVYIPERSSNNNTPIGDEKIITKDKEISHQNVLQEILLTTSAYLVAKSSFDAVVDDSMY